MPESTNQYRPAAPASHETASPESGDRAQTTMDRHGRDPEPKVPDVPDPADHEYASPESGDRAHPPAPGK